MKATLLIVGFAALTALTSTAFGRATSDLSGLDEDTRALIAKERTRQMMFKNKGDSMQKQYSDEGSSSSGGNKNSSSLSGPSGLDSKKNSSSSSGPSGLDSKRAIVKSGGVTGGCNIDIGNSDGGMGSKPRPVIITGPIVQLCK